MQIIYILGTERKTLSGCYAKTYHACMETFFKSHLAHIWSPIDLILVVSWPPTNPFRPDPIYTTSNCIWKPARPTPWRPHPRHRQYLDQCQTLVLLCFICKCRLVVTPGQGCVKHTPARLHTMVRDYTHKNRGENYGVQAWGGLYWVKLT